MAFTDHSATNHISTAVQTGAESSTQKKFGDQSLRVTNHASGSGVVMDANTCFEFGTGNFTVEGWVYFDSAGVSNATLVSQWATSVSLASFALFLASGNLYFRFYDSTDTLRDTSAAWAPSATTWYHVAADRSGTTVRIYVDGVVKATQTYGQSFKTGLATPVTVGYVKDYEGTYNANGYIDEVRVSNIARYNGAFTAPTAAFNNDSATVLLQKYNTNKTLSGNITESSAITAWRVAAFNQELNRTTGTTTTTGTSYSISCDTVGPCTITLMPKIDYTWSPGRITTSGDFVTAVAPDSTPHIWTCTSAGTTHATTEPTWNLSSTTTDNSTTWTYVAPLVDPKSLGPRTPA